MNGKCILCQRRMDGRKNFVCRRVPSRVQDFPISREDLACSPVDLRLIQCEKCGLLQLDEHPVDYYKDSVRVFERSKALVDLRIGDYKKLIEGYNLKGKKIIEIGAGKGGFLETLREISDYNMDIYGIEYNPEFAEESRNKGLNVFAGDPEDPYQVLEGAPYDAFVCFSYFARLVNPNDMLELVRNNLVDGGMGMIVTLGGDHILSPGGVFEITSDLMGYYDHKSLRLICELNGFEVLEEGVDGGVYNYVIVRKRILTDVKYLEAEYEGLLKQTCNHVRKLKQKRKTVAVWCAGHFSLVLISASQIGKDIEFIVDNAPVKQGKYAPGSGVPVVSVDFLKGNMVDHIIVMGELYEKEIVSYIKKEFKNAVELSSIGTAGIKEY